jgi:hypothetical protein
MRQAAEEMDRHNSKMAIVVDDQDRFCGIISEHCIEQFVLGIDTSAD